MTGAWSEFAPALPEIVLAVAGMVLLMIGVFRGDRSTGAVSYLAALIFLAVAALVILREPPAEPTAFGGLFITDEFARVMKTLVLLGSAFALVMGQNFLRQENMARFEYPVLFVFATLGMLMMVSANDLISLYLSLELQSLSLYVIAAIQRDNARSSEAGLKYFVLGALSSGMLLYGASLVYGFAGTTDFTAMAGVFAAGEVGSGVIVGIVFIIAGLAFKVSAVPFHMWTPDVYEGAPTPVTAFFAIAPKVAAMALFLRVMMGPFGDQIDAWRQVIQVAAIASMVLGAFAAIAQRNIKRLMAYSSIGHIGFALVGLAAGSPGGVRGVIIYMVIYLAMNVGTFTCILAMRVNGRAVEGVQDLAGLSRTRPMMAAALAILMFSLAGLPPLAGFFAKYYVFVPAIEAGLVPLAVIGVLASVVAAFYYLRIVKLMYFDEAAEALDPLTAGMSAVLTLSTLFVLVFIIFPAPLIAVAGRAAQSLIVGL